MSTGRRRLGLGLAVVVMAAASAACSSAPAAPHAEPPVVVEEVPGTELSRLALSAHAAQRLAIATAPVVEAPADGQLTIPYSAVVYGPDGRTWTYTNPEGLVYIRHLIDVAHITGDTAVLTAGPPLGTSVVTVGAAELWGAETGVGGGH